MTVTVYLVTRRGERPRSDNRDEWHRRHIEVLKAELPSPPHRHGGEVVSSAPVSWDLLSCYNSWKSVKGDFWYRRRSRQPSQQLSGAGVIDKFSGARRQSRADFPSVQGFNMCSSPSENSPARKYTLMVTRLWYKDPLHHIIKQNSKIYLIIKR